MLKATILELVNWPGTLYYTGFWIQFLSYDLKITDRKRTKSSAIILCYLRKSFYGLPAQAKSGGHVNKFCISGTSRISTHLCTGTVLHSMRKPRNIHLNPTALDGSMVSASPLKIATFYHKKSPIIIKSQQKSPYVMKSHFGGFQAILPKIMKFSLGSGNDSSYPNTMCNTYLSKLVPSGFININVRDLHLGHEWQCNFSGGKIFPPIFWMNSLLPNWSYTCLHTKKAYSHTGTSSSQCVH